MGDGMGGRVPPAVAAGEPADGGLGQAESAADVALPDTAGEASYFGNLGFRQSGVRRAGTAKGPTSTNHVVCVVFDGSGR